MPLTKILIVEDEPIIAEDMANKLIKSGYDVTGCVDNCEAAIESAKTNPPDLIFMDIAISGEKDGIETAKELKSIEDFIVIFLTNLHDEKTMKRAVAINPANYLHKPFTEHQLHVSIRTALINAEKQLTGITAQVRKSEPESHTRGNKLFLRDSNGAYHKYDITDILYIEAERAYCIIHTSKGNLIQSINMSATNDKLNHPSLIKVHRSYIVNIDNVDTLKGNVLVIKGNEIAISDQYKDEVLKLLPLVK